MLLAAATLAVVAAALSTARQGTGVGTHAPTTAGGGWCGHPAGGVAHHLARCPPRSDRVGYASEPFSGRSTMHPAPAESLRIEAPSSLPRSDSLVARRGGTCPPLHQSFMSRPRLVDALLGDREASVVLLCAPAGYGKTSVLSEWAERDGRPFAWLALRDEHNDRRRLLSSLALAAEQLQSLDRPSLGGSGVRLVGEAVVPGLLEAFESDREGAVLVLDDVQAVHSREALAVLARLAAGMPSHSKLVLASRTKPALAVARLRAQRVLLSWGVRELAMTPPEAAELLADAGVDLAPDELAQAMTLTEGWPATLYLAAIAVGETAMGPAR